MREITVQEQKLVAGGFGPAGAALGAATAAAGHLGYAATSGNFSFGGFLRDVAIGAATGAVLGPASSAARAYFAPRVAGVVGSGFGWADPRMKWRN